MRRLAWLFVLLPLLLSVATAQESLEDRLNSDRVGYAEPGAYMAGDGIGFALDRYGANYLLRFSGSPEVFVLYEDRASFGGRVLKYDSGETALTVAGWGGLTLYVPQAPGGLPAARTGDSFPPQLQAVSVSDVQGAAADETQHIAYTRRLAVAFGANWAQLGQDGNACALALDTLANAARGLERFSATPQGRDALARRVGALQLAYAERPSITLSGRTLIVTFNPARGYVGRASSRAIARGLGTLLGVR